METRKRLTSNTFLLHLLPAGTVLITVLGLTLLGWRNANEALKNEQQVVMQNISEDTESKIRERLNTYEVILKSASTLYTSSDQVDRADWKAFVDGFNIKQEHPGILGIGYSQLVTSDEIPAFTEKVRASGVADFNVHPKTKNKEHSVVLYYEPLVLKNSLGYDQMSEADRAQAVNYVKQTGKTALTQCIVYALDNQSGFSLFMPVYADSQQASKPPAQRKLQGLVFVPVVSQKIFDGLLNQINDRQNYGVRVYDSEISDNNLIFESSNYKNIQTAGSTSKSIRMDLYGREWVVDFRLSPNIIAETTRSRPVNSLIVGTMLSLLLSGFVLSLLVARTRVLAHSKQAEVQSAKDELLSLASHQLRTPATSVKQYIGMALEGFAGKLSPQQTNLLDKAYESNERQLHIINEILYVAKIDAKGIVLTPRRINMNKLLRDLIQELSTSAKKSRQKIRLQMPKRQIMITADEYCMRMALENIISNALKYSHEGKTVSVKMMTAKDVVHISVKDKGVGIDPDDMAQLFQRFSRIPNELSRQTNGSGIGLYLSQQLIELHSGTIEVESEKGQGTTFLVTLPKNYVQPGENE